MSKKIFIFAMALAVLVSAHPAYAQQAGKVYRIGILTGGSAATAKRNIDPFRVKVRDLNKFQSAYEAMAKDCADALIILHSGFAYSHRRQLLMLAAENHLPSMCEEAR